MIHEHASPAEIRHAHAGDATAIAGLLTQLGYPADAADMPERMTRFLAGGVGRLFVAESRGEVAAFAALEVTHPVHHAAPVAHLSAFVVNAAFRRRGIGRALLAAVELAACDAGCHRIVVTSAEHREDAHGFYIGAGWQYTGRRFARVLT